MAEFNELDVAILVARALESLGLRYLIGGSLASSLHGVPRSSHDADMLAEVPQTRADDIARLLEPQFYVDANMIRDAIRHRISFNVIHYDSGFKVDVFVLTNDAMPQEEMRRRQPHDVGDAAGPVFFATAEDMVLQKLAWYRAGGESSDRQWTDVLGILKVKGSTLDFAYVRRWAPVMGVADLLERLVKDPEAGS